MDIKQWLNEVKDDEIPTGFQDIAEAIGLEALLKLSFTVGGTTLYIPKLDFFIQKARERLIIAEYDGTNIKEITLKYQMSDAWVRKIIHDYHLDKDQLKMFDLASGE